MQNYKIISDSSCDLPDDILQKFDIDLVPYYVTFDTVKYYREKAEISNETFYRTISDSSVFPKTSLPPIQDYIDIFERHLKKGEDIICMCLSSVFSGSFQSANNAKNMLLEDYPDRRIEIVDTKQATSGQGLVVYQAALMREAGYTMDALLEKIEKLKYTAKINFTVDSLEHLQKGGRIGKASALAGSLLNIKPIIVMSNGELSPVAKVRGHKKAIKTIIDMTVNEIAAERDKYLVCLLSAVRKEEPKEIMAVLEEEYGIKAMRQVCEIGVTIGTHAGPTAIGISYIKKYSEIE